MRRLLFTVLMLLPFIVIGQTTEKIKYYESGAIQVKANFVDGKVQGEVIFYTLNGEIEEIEYYKDGVLINNK